MQTRNRLWDDFTHLASGVLGLVQGVLQQRRQGQQAQIEAMMRAADLVSREEHEVVRAMAQQARLECEALKKQMQQSSKKRAMK